VSAFPCGNSHLPTNPSVPTRLGFVFLGTPQGDYLFAFSPISTRRRMAANIVAVIVVPRRRSLHTGKQQANARKPQPSPAESGN